MSRELFNELISKTEGLSLEEKHQLIRYLSSDLNPDDDRTGKSRRKWREIRGKAPYPLMEEDAQVWVSRTRQEANYGIIDVGNKRVRIIISI